MSTATELLRRAYEVLDRFAIYDDLRDEIEIFLAAEPEAECSDHPDAPHGFDRNASHNSGRYVCTCESWEPEAEPRVWMMTRDDIEGAAFEFSKEQVETYWENRGYTIEPLYTRPEPAIRKPMTEEEIKAEAQSEKFNRCDAIVFAAGIRFAEKHHGIGGDDPETDFGNIAEKREWQGLTDEERDEVSKDYGPLSGGEWTLMLLVEQALKEKNDER